ncbi:MAG: hypothetical protein IJO41_04775 [Oscillospiraceae bacterium]|nr:hypothetical protein [Oscillospiraceae bacterium]MBQ9837290.1 hypothetical protein [Oscillospiraceae bacterium]
MKKIVALVLSLVMVLGLATTAMAASYNLTGTYDFKSTSETGTALAYTGVSLAVIEAAAAKDTDKDGLIDVPGNVEWLQVNTDNSKYVKVASVAEADYTIYYAGTTTVFAYVDAIAYEDCDYMGNGVPFTNFGEECGQLDKVPTEGAKYYSFEGAVYVAAKAAVTDDALMVNGVLTPVTLVAAANDADWVAHAAVYTYDKDYKVVGVKCGECGCVAAIYANYASVPKADKADAVALGGGAYYVWTAAVEAPEASDKVESAQTFDAGIAMYVGMSVMAAAGSAVVLKKKD